MSPSTARQRRDKRTGRYKVNYLRKIAPSLILLSITIALSLFFARQNPEPLFSVRASDAQEVELVSPLPVRIEVSPTPSPSLTPSPIPTPTPEVCLSEKCEVMKLIIEVFGEDAPRAIAVAKAESGLNPNREAIKDAGHYSWSSPTYPGECSIGLYMINLKSDGCKGTNVHWNKVPGETLEEKIAWLKVPENNIKLAKKIYDAAGKSFNPWGAFTNGSFRSL